MDGYLIDTNIVNFWHNANLPENLNVSAQIAALAPRELLTISIVTIGEIYFGHRTASTPDPARQAALEQFIATQFPKPMPVTKHTANYYAELRSRLFKKYPPAGKKQRRPEQCLDPITALELGIDENDLWIAAQAVERNYILVTHDAMARIKDVTKGLLVTKDWTEPI